MSATPIEPVEPEAPAADAAPEVDPEGAEALGDAGKKALDTMKADRNAARDAARAEKARADAAEAELAKLRAAAEGREAEFTAAEERKALEAAYLDKANARIKAAEVRAVAASKLNDPEDAQRFLSAEIAALEVGEDGAVDRDAIAALLDGLIDKKPYLAAQGRRFEGSPDGGARPPVPAKTIDDQIAEAEAAGDYATAGQLKAQRLLSLPNPN